MKKFITENSTVIKILRTVSEALISWLAVNLAELVGLFHLNSSVEALLVSALTVVFTAVLGVIQDKHNASEQLK